MVSPGFLQKRASQMRRRIMRKSGGNEVRIFQGSSCSYYCITANVKSNEIKNTFSLLQPNSLQSFKNVT